MPPKKIQKRQPSKTKVVLDKSTLPKRPRGRPRKNPIKESPNNIDCNDDLVQPLSVLFPEDSFKVPAADGVFTNTHGSDHSKRKGRKRKGFSQGISACNLAPKNSTNGKKLKSKGKKGSSGGSIHMRLLAEMEDSGSSTANPQANNSSEQDHVASSNMLLNSESLGNGLASYLIPDDVASPRIVLCLAHNGKVAWDAKWRPSCVNDSKCKYRMGYLAVILGNGSLEV